MMPSDPHTGSCGVVDTGHVRGQLAGAVAAFVSRRFTFGQSTAISSSGSEAWIWIEEISEERIETDGRKQKQKTMRINQAV